MTFIEVEKKKEKNLRYFDERKYNKSFRILTSNSTLSLSPKYILHRATRVISLKLQVILYHYSGQKPTICSQNANSFCMVFKTPHDPVFCYLSGFVCYQHPLTPPTLGMPISLLFLEHAWHSLAPRIYIYCSLHVGVAVSI